MSTTQVAIGRRMARGAGWMLLARLCVRSIGFVSTIILARLLLPEDFGLVAATMVLVAGLEAVSEFGFQVFLITKQDSEDAHYDTVWTLTILRGVFIASILFIGAPIFSEFFEEPRIVEICYWIALATLVSGFINPGFINYQKELRFFRELMWMVGTKLTSFVVVIVLAFMWRDYWALVAGIITNHAARVLFSFVLHPYRPSLGLKRISDMAGFSGWMMLNSIVMFLRNRGDRLILGKFLGMGALGIYTVAFELVDLISTEVIAPIRRVLLPGFSRVAPDRKKMGELFVDTTALLVMLITPLSVGLSLVADPIVRLALGNNWLECIPLMQILCIYAFFNVWSSAGSSVFLSLQKPHLLTGVSIATTVVFVPLTAFAAYMYGAQGVAYAVAVTAGGIVLVQWTVVSRLLSLSLKAVFQRTWRVFLALAGMAGAVWGAQNSIALPDGLGWQFGQLILFVVAGAVTYVLILLASWFAVGRPQGPEQTALNAMAEKVVGRRPRFLNSANSS